MSDSFSERLFHALQNVDRPGSFCVSGSLPAVLPGLEVEGLGPIGLPLTAGQARELKARCEQAPYGKGEETLVDTSVRRVWRLTPDRFQLTNPDWQMALAVAVEAVQTGLGLEGKKLEAHLYDLLLYEKGSFFLPHQDGEKLDRMVATLVIVLPSAHEGGELVVRHEGQEETIDFGAADNSRNKVQFAAFYADCEHEVRPLVAGYRLCLVYNLTLAKSRSKKGLAAPRSAEHLDAIRAILEDWPAGEEGPRKLAIPLEHQYTQDGLAWDALKGVDAARAHVLRQAARQAHCKAYLALLTFHESGSAEGGGGWGRGRRGGWYDYEDEGDAGDYEMGEVFESSLTAEHWMDDEGERVELGTMDVELEEVVPEEALTEVEPETEFEGYTGNAGMTLDHWYRHGAVFLWPEARHFDVLCDCGHSGAQAALDALVDRWQGAGKKEAEALKAQCVAFAVAIMARWPTVSYGMIGRGPKELDFTRVLAKLNEPDLVRTFLRDVLPKDPSVDLSPAFLGVCKKRGWADFADDLAAVLKNTTLESLPRNVRLLDRLCSSGSGKKEDELWGRLAREAVSALQAIDGQPQDWRARDLDRAEVLAGLVRALVSAGQSEGLSQLVEHVLATPKKYPLLPVQMKAWTTLAPWLKKNVKAPVAGLTRWMAACREQMEALTAEEPQAPADFRREAPITCKCADCRELIAFLKSPDEKVHRFSMPEDRRSHLEHTIRTQQCDARCSTERGRRPYTLVCTKNTATYERRLKKYHEDLAHLAELRAIEAGLPA